MPDVINKVVSLFTGDGESPSDKDVLLKQIAKDISHNKYAKFYRARQAEIDVSLAQYFYNICKITHPIAVFLRDPVKDAKIRQITLESFLDKQIMDVIKRLSPEAIAERKRTGDADLPKLLQADLSALGRGFDSPKIAAADKCYNLIASMKQFVSYNFYSLIRKFDPDIREGDFVTPPRFIPVDSSVMVNDLSSFLAILFPFDEEMDWKTVFEILKYCKGGTDIVPLAHWNALLTNLKDLKQSNILDLILKFITGNPFLKIKTITPHETLSGSYLDLKINEVQQVISDITGSQRDAQIKALEQAVFGPLATVRLIYYTADKGNILADKELDTYMYAPALNHLITFIQEYLSKEIQELCDILLIRGKWTNNSASRLMSDGFHDTVDLVPGIIKIDESLSEDGSEGPRLRGALLKVDRDRTQARYINSIVNGINEEALNVINKAVPSLIVVGKHFKLLMDDYEKKPFELIMNWKELAGVSKVPLNQRIASAYKKINYFVQLMLMETKGVEEQV